MLTATMVSFLHRRRVTSSVISLWKEQAQARASPNVAMVPPNHRPSIPPPRTFVRATFPGDKTCSIDGTP
jgi:hypothetical protein